MNRSAVSAALLGLACVAVFANGMRGKFCYDEQIVIVRNEVIRDISKVGRIFSTEYWGSHAPQSESKGFRPLTILSYALNYAFGKLDPLGYHVFNLLLHILNTLLVFFLARRFASFRTALAAGALFAVHAVHTEAVTQIVGRAELLSFAFTLGALLMQTGKRWRWLALPLYGLGLLSKESSVIMPVLALIYEVLQPAATAPEGKGLHGEQGAGALGQRLKAAFRRSWWCYLGYGLLFLSFLLYRAAALGKAFPTYAVHLVDNPIAHADPLPALLTATAVIGRYLLLLFAPIALSADYGYNAIPLTYSPFSPAFLLPLLIIMAALSWVLIYWRRYRGVSFSLLFFLIALFPLSNFLVYIHTIMGERLLYLPSAGFCLALALGGGKIIERRGPRMRWALMVLLTAFLLLNGIRTIVRNEDWLDTSRLFLAARQVTPGSVRVRNNAGNALTLKAMALLREAHKAPDGPSQKTLLYRARLVQKKAIDEYRAALKIYPAYHDARVNLAILLLRQGRRLEAREQLDSVLGQQPGHRRARALRRHLDRTRR